MELDVMELSSMRYYENQKTKSYKQTDAYFQKLNKVKAK